MGGGQLMPHFAIYDAEDAGELMFTTYQQGMYDACKKAHTLVREYYQQDVDSEEHTVYYHHAVIEIPEAQAIPQNAGELGDEIESERSITTEVHPQLKCGRDPHSDHEWDETRAPFGGDGAGINYQERCRRCNAQKETNTWHTDTFDGTQDHNYIVLSQPDDDYEWGEPI